MDRITKEYLDEIFDFDLEQGVVFWKKSLGRAGSVGNTAGTLNKNSGYIDVGIHRKQYRLHRVIWMHVYGEWPKNEIDHIDHDKTNNSFHNLRAVTKSENMKNKTKYKNNKSGVCGVHWCNPKNGYVVQIVDNSIKRTLTCTKDFFEACCVRKSAELKLNYHQNHGA